MTFVVTEQCIRCKFTDCVEVCPVDCFHEGPNFLVIDPKTCIDCALCVPECPVDAIYDENDLPDDMLEFTEINARLAGQWPQISARQDPLADADDWADRLDKRKWLDETAAVFATD